MIKKTIGARNYLYPMPTVLAGAIVNDKPNFITVAYCGIVQNKPPMIAIALGKMHYTNIGIKQNKQFSICLPSESMLEVTDYIGIYSGKQVDKSELFNVFYGTLDKAPMIDECPLTMECKLIDALDYGGTSDIFIGEIIQVYTSDEYITEGLPDIKKLKPIAFSMYDNNYWSIGNHLGKAWLVGKDFNPNE